MSTSFKQYLVELSLDQYRTFDTNEQRILGISKKFKTPEARELQNELMAKFRKIKQAGNITALGELMDELSEKIQEL